MYEGRVFLFADEADGVSVVGDIGVSERYIVGAEVEVLGIVLLFACGGPIYACGVYVAYFGAISIAAGGQKYCSCELHFVPLVCAVFVFGEVFFPESIAYARSSSFIRSNSVIKKDAFPENGKTPLLS